MSRIAGGKAEMEILENRSIFLVAMVPLVPVEVMVEPARAA